MAQRLLRFDIAKAICIILVVIGHYIPDNSPSWYVLIHDWIYLYHMPLFMFASGYIYIAFKKEEKYSHFLWKKFRRLMIPYFVTSIIVISIKLVTQGSMFVQNPVTWRSYFKIFYLPEAGYFLWFIWALFLIFCVVPLFKKRTYRTFLFVVSVLLHYWPHLSLPEIFCVSQAVKMLMWFMFGVMCYDWNGELNAIFMGNKLTSLLSMSLAVVVFAVGSFLYVFNVGGDMI